MPALVVGFLVEVGQSHQLRPTVAKLWRQSHLLWRPTAPAGIPNSLDCTSLLINDLLSNSVDHSAPTEPY